MPLTQVPGSMINGTGFASLSGVTFPATQVQSTNANTLDDYEEGTWTPVVTFSGNSVGQSYVSQSGKYTKIGNQVFLSCIITMTNKGSSTGAAWVTGVPFTENGDYGIGWTALDGGFANIPSNGFGTYGIIAGSAIYLRYTTSAGGFTNLDNTNFTNSSQLYINLFYKTT